VIIDMGDQVNFLVQALMQAGKHDEPPQVAELLRIGESALPVLIQHFPGPLWVDPAALRAGKVPRGRDVSAVARALCAFGAKAAPYLAGKLASGDDEISYYALLVAGEIVHPDLLDAVARRALGSEAGGLRLVALQVLRRYSRLPQFATVLRALSDLSERPGKDGKRQRLALEALGELRDARSLATLIARLSDENEAIAQSAHKALVQLTAQEFGTAARRWESWAEQFGGQHRIEWLIDSLMHADANMRTLAGEELKRETQQYFGYHPALPKRERELAQRKYREWWQQEGRAAFATT
jgi:HEAT repeat protein